MNDRILPAPSAQRNREPILAVLRQALPASGLVLEIASGSGAHIAHFASALPKLAFQPSDPDEAALSSIAAWTSQTGLTNIRPPIRLDAAATDWPVMAADAIVCINMIHISPWRAAEGLFANAARCLHAGAPLYLYGPYRRRGLDLEPSNQAFDESLRSRNAEWGLRELDSISALAVAAGFGAPAITEMPANNLSLIFRRL